VEDEAAAVEVHDHRELFAPAAWDLRDEDAGVQVVGDGVVRGCHAADGGRRGERRGAVEEGEQEAVDGAIAAERGGVQRGGGAHKQPRAPRQRGLPWPRRRVWRGHRSPCPSVSRAGRSQALMIRAAARNG